MKLWIVVDVDGIDASRNDPHEVAMLALADDCVGLADSAWDRDPAVEDGPEPAWRFVAAEWDGNEGDLFGTGEEET